MGNIQINPFLVGVGLMNAAASVWAFTHSSPIMGWSMIAYTMGAIAQSMVSQ